MEYKLPTRDKRPTVPRHRVKSFVLIVDDRIPAATLVRWGTRNAPTEVVVRPDVDDQALGMLFRTLAIVAGTSELDRS
jgi:hypothetical protein